MPKAGKNQVIVKEAATSINPIDWKLREGYLKQMMDWEFPIILGWDVAGVISEVGEGVTDGKLAMKYLLVLKQHVLVRMLNIQQLMITYLHHFQKVLVLKKLHLFHLQV